MLSQSVVSQSHIGFWYSLRTRLLLFFLALSVIPLVIVSLISYFQSQTALTTRIKADLKSRTELQGKMLSIFLTERKDNMVVLAGTARVRTMDPTKVVDAIDQYYKQWGLYENLGLYGLDGETIYRTDKTAISVADRPYFQAAVKGETSVSDPVVSKATGNIVFVVASPVIEKNIIIGVITGSIPTTIFSDFISADELGKGDGYLVNQEGFLITPSNHTEELIKQGIITNRSELEYQPDTVAVKGVLAGKDAVEEYTDPLGGAVIGAYLPIEGSTWGLVIENRSSEVLAAVNNLRWIFIIAISLAIILVVILALIISNNITRPILNVAAMSQTIARGEIPKSKISTNKKDEIGLLESSFAQIIEYFQQISNFSAELAKGNLTVDIQAKSKEDIVGQSLSGMAQQFRSVISELVQQVKKLESASSSLTLVANQVDDVSGQIAVTIQQIAKGSAQQSESITKTSSSVDELAKAIDEVARGAQDQTNSITQVTDGTEEMTSTIQKVAGNAFEVVAGSTKAADAAQHGSSIVEKTLEGMQSIKDAVGLSARKVEEMGSRSDQIGEIVTTIEDIASQTNLLALNAAIEAARAGEAGKGFAVVADEVRKLADRSSSATREIGDLIRTIQKTVSEAVTSMVEGGRQIDQGVQYANEAGLALIEIRSSTKAVSDQAELAAQAIQRMDQMTTHLLNAAQNVSAVVEENTAATEQMAASSTEVAQAIENIAAVSEENSAAVEEVSASTEEMAAQMEEVARSAQSMSEIAQQLNKMINQFKVDASS